MSHARKTRGRALIYGHDRELLETRGLLLEADGYASDLASSLKELEKSLAAFPSYVLVVLCHTVYSEEVGEIHRLLEQTHTGVPVYTMSNATSPQELLDGVAGITGKAVILSKE